MCCILIPRFEERFSEEVDAECVLPNAHTEPHLCQLRSGQWIEWEPDQECEDCDHEDYCECFVWWEVAASVADHNRGL